MTLFTLGWTTLLLMTSLAVLMKGLHGFVELLISHLLIVALFTLLDLHPLCIIRMARTMMTFTTFKFLLMLLVIKGNDPFLAPWEFNGLRPGISGTGDS